MQYKNSISDFPSRLWPDDVTYIGWINPEGVNNIPVCFDSEINSGPRQSEFGMVCIYPNDLPIGLKLEVFPTEYLIELKKSRNGAVEIHAGDGGIRRYQLVSLKKVESEDA